MARVIACEPPSATGQPWRWAALPSTTPTAEDMRRRTAGTRGRRRRRTARCRRACATHRASTLAGSAGMAPKRGQGSGWAGTWSTGREEVLGDRRSKSLGERCRTAPASARPSPPGSWAAVCSSERYAAAPSPPSSGWEYCTSGQRQRSPSARRGRTRARTALSSASGWAAEHSSWIRPGSVSSPQRVPPPIRSAASSTVHLQRRPRPASRRQRARWARCRRRRPRLTRGPAAWPRRRGGSLRVAPARQTWRTRS